MAQSQAQQKMSILHQSQQHIEAALTSIKEAQALDNTQAILQTEQNIQMAMQTLQSNLNQVDNPTEKMMIEQAQQSLQEAQKGIQKAQTQNSSSMSN